MASQMSLLTRPEIIALTARNEVVHQESIISGLPVQFCTLRDCTLSYVQASDCVVIGGYITNSTLKNCTLLDCKLENTKAENSKLQTCALFPHNYVRGGYTYACDARDSQFIDCSISVSKIRR
jgi:uncharacterized protein YjbI with pentapeptide repeats